MIINRRGFLSFLGAGLIAAPAIVRAASLMPVRGIVMPVTVLNDLSDYVSVQMGNDLEREIWEFATKDQLCMAPYEPYPIHPDAERRVVAVRPRDMEKYRREMAVW
jgi:hypothetical protein